MGRTPENLALSVSKPLRRAIAYLGVAPLERRGIVARKSRRHACLLALSPALPLLSHVLARPPWYCACYRPCRPGGASRSARIPFEGDILTNTDFRSSTTACTDPFADRGTPKSLPTNYLGTQFRRDLVAGAAGPERTAFSTDSSARSGNPLR